MWSTSHHGFATWSFVQDRSSALSPKLSQDLLPLFLLPTFPFLCQLALLHCPGPCLGKGTLDPASQIAHERKSCPFIWKSSRGVKCWMPRFMFATFCKHLWNMHMSKSCLLFHLWGQRQVSLIDFFCSKGNKENKCITTCGRTCVLLIRTGALRMGQAIHVWILRKSKWLM